MSVLTVCSFRLGVVPAKVAYQANVWFVAEEAIVTQTVPGLLRRAAEEFGDATAYVMDGRTLTFSELHDAVRRTAAVYRTKASAPAGESCSGRPTASTGSSPDSP